MTDKKRRGPGGPPPKGLEARKEHGNVCTAKRTNGQPCANFAINGSHVCRIHGGAAPQVRARAQVRILMASDLAAKKLIDMLTSPKVADNIKLAAAKDLLDRANLAGTQNVEIGVTPKKSFEDYAMGAMVDAVETDDGDWFLQYGDGTHKIVPKSAVGREFKHGDVIMDVGWDDDPNVIDAEVVYEPDDNSPLVPRDPDATFDTNRHDRAVFAEVERGRADEHKRMQRGGMSDAERQRRESDALAEVSRSTRSTVDPTIARAAYIAALDNGATREEAEAAGRASAEGVPDTGKRRARITDATITDAAGERRRR